MIMKYSLFIFVVLFLNIIHAQTKSINDEALTSTQNMLRSSAQRSEVIKNDSNAKKADQDLESLVGTGSAKEQVYELSADVMKYLVDNSSGDPVKMQESLMKGMSDPKAFLNSLPDDVKNKIRNIATEVESKSKKP